MRRRKFVTLLGGAAAAWPLAAHAQPERMRRIGVLMASAESDPQNEPRLAAFRQGLQALGWTGARNIKIDYRFAAADPVRMRAHAAELVQMKADLIVANTPPVVEAVQQQTRAIPIVFVPVADPVGAGFVKSLARPGGNITGVTDFEFTIGGKWLELIKEMMPAVTRVAVTVLAGHVTNVGIFQAMQAAAPALGLQLTAAVIGDAADIEDAIAAFARDPDGGLVVPPGATIAHRDLLVALAARHRLPAIYPFRFIVVGGGLMSYGPDNIAIYRQAAWYVDRILKGEKPAELPVQAPTKFELAINLKTAKALGLDVPPTLLARADEVIE
jgi:putative ABC transport system substrate-binding protein